jgi:hypothetical protein
MLRMTRVNVVLRRAQDYGLIEEVVVDEIFIDAGVGAEFFYGNELVFLFAECFADILYEGTGRTVFTAGDVFDVFGINDEPPGYAPGNRHRQLSRQEEIRFGNWSVVNRFVMYRSGQKYCEAVHVKGGK